MILPTHIVSIMYKSICREICTPRALEWAKSWRIIHSNHISPRVNFILVEIVSFSDSAGRIIRFSRKLHERCWFKRKWFVRTCLCGLLLCKSEGFELSFPLVTHVWKGVDSIRRESYCIISQPVSQERRFWVVMETNC